MKRLILLLFILVFIPPCESRAQCTEDKPCPEVARLMPWIGGGVPAGGGCDVNTNEIGDRSVEATAETVPAGYAYIFRAQADCTGTLETAYFYHQTTTGTNGKICIYTSTNANPTVGGGSDTKVGCSAQIESNAVEWATGNIGSGSVTQDSWYWVVMIGSSATDSWPCARTNAISLWYADWSANYDSPPNTLGTTWTEAATSAPFSAYVRIQ